MRVILKLEIVLQVRSVLKKLYIQVHVELDWYR